jgi:hypothetical protein
MIKPERPRIIDNKKLIESTLLNDNALLIIQPLIDIFNPAIIVRTIT